MKAAKECGITLIGANAEEDDFFSRILSMMNGTTVLCVLYKPGDKSAANGVYLNWSQAMILSAKQGQHSYQDDTEL